MIQPRPKMKSAMKLIFMKTRGSSLVVQYLERMILMPIQVAAVAEPKIIRKVAPFPPFPREIMSTPPKFMNTPRV